MTAVIAVVWGASFLFIRYGVESFGAPLVPALRIAFGVIALGILPAARRPVASRDWPVIALLGLIWMALPFLLFSLAERTVPTSITGMINGSVPLVAAAVGALWQRKVPSLRRALALSCGLVGVTMIAFSAARDAHTRSDVAGVAMLLVAVVCYGVSANVAVPLQRRYGSLAVLFRVQLVALVLSLPYALVAAGAMRFSWVGLGAMFLLGTFGTGLAYVVNATLAGRTDATRGSIGVFLTPIVATLLGVMVEHESVPLGALAGAAVVLVGAALTSRPEPVGARELAV